MSINDPLVLEYRPRRGTWIITRGRETFYNDERELIEWEDHEDAIAWAQEALKETPIFPGEDPGPPALTLEVVVRAYLTVQQLYDVIGPYGGPRAARRARQVRTFRAWLHRRLFDDAGE